MFGRVINLLDVVVVVSVFPLSQGISYYVCCFILNSKLTLSMRDVDQTNGNDLSQKRAQKKEKKRIDPTCTHGEITGIPLHIPDTLQGKKVVEVDMTHIQY